MLELNPMASEKKREVKIERVINQWKVNKHSPVPGFGSTHVSRLYSLTDDFHIIPNIGNRCKRLLYGGKLI